jgi:hypothetical protein
MNVRRGILRRRSNDHNKRVYLSVALYVPAVEEGRSERQDKKMKTSEDDREDVKSLNLTRELLSRQLYNLWARLLVVVDCARQERSRCQFILLFLFLLFDGVIVLSAQ